MRVAVLISILAGSVFAAEVKLPTSAEAIANGKRLYMGGCTYCHGPTGDGGKGANLAAPELIRARTDEDLVNIIQTGVPGSEMPGAAHMTPNEVLMTAAFVRTLGKVASGPLTGNAGSGKSIYGKRGCANCHTVTEGGVIRGGLMGPDLSSIGLKRSPAHLRVSIADPGAEVSRAYEHTSVVLKDGRRIVGRTLNEDSFSILMRDWGGANHAIEKTAVERIERDSRKSAMPRYPLPEAEMDDLVAYLATLKERP